MPSRKREVEGHSEMLGLPVGFQGAVLLWSISTNEAKEPGG